MQVPLNLISEGSYDTGVALPNVKAAPTAGKIKECIPVKVFNYGAFTLLDNKWGIGSERRGYITFLGGEYCG